VNTIVPDTRETTATEDVSRVVARHIATFDASRLPREAVELTKLSILDTIGVTLAASGLVSSAGPVYELVTEAGGNEESSLLGYSAPRVPAHMAAFANGALAHGLDFDDLDHEIALHPSTSTVPSALALAEAAGGIAGRELVTAVALGNDFATRLGYSIVWKSDWFTTPLFGFFTSAAVSARLLGLDAERTAAAIGIAFAQAGGTLEMRYSTGSDIAGIYAAWPNKAGIIAARLAAKGIGGIEHAFEGSRGLFPLFFGEYDRSVLTDDLGERFRGTDVSFKPWPSCGLTHNPIDGVLELMREHGIAPADIEEITYATGNPNAWALCMPLEARRRPHTAMDARFSIPHALAAAAVYGDVTLAAYTPEALVDADVLAMADRVRPVFDESRWQPTPIPAVEIGIRTRDGESFAREVAVSYGRAPERPIQPDDVVKKFRSCARFAAVPLPDERVDRVVELVLHLEEVEDTSELHAALVAT
jgi:2-methylcitrate dehydratase PrpD